MSAKKIHLIAAARPNFMKVAPLYRALRKQPWCVPHIVHTGQHYDANMSDAFFKDLELPEPKFNLGVGSGSHAEQMARTMLAYEPVCRGAEPDAIVVAGDVNATAACTLVGAKLRIPVVHLEAGLRSRDRRMPEEINRIVTDSIADLLWTPSPDADENLRMEGIAGNRVVRIGNIMIDSFEMLRDRIYDSRTTAGGRDWKEMRPYAVVTLHRPGNVDGRDRLGEMIDMLEELSTRIHIEFPVHPRTRKMLQELGLERRVSANHRIRISEPLGYVEFMRMLRESALAVTDSGGIQEETTYLGIPCITVRENTERPITITHGTNRLARPDEVIHLAGEALSGRWPKGGRPEYWDGRAAERAVDSLRHFLAVDLGARD